MKRKAAEGMAEDGTLCVEADYMEGFQCDGAACDAACCKKWMIFIDDACRARWEAIPDPKLREEALSALIPREDDPTRDRINMDRTDGVCPFLTEEHLCKLQKHLGEPILSDVCASYPRILRGYYGIVERAVTISCLVACRRVLLAPHPLRLTVRRLPAGTFRPHLVAQLTDEICARLPYVFEIRGAGIELLSNEAFTRDEHLILLGEFLFAAEDLIEECRGGEISALADRFLGLRREDRPSPLNEKDFRVREYLRFFFRIFDEAIGDEDIALIFHHRGDRLAEKILKAYRIADGKNSLDDLAKRYERNRRNYERRVAEPYARILDNEIVQAYYSAFDPFRFDCSLKEGFLLFFSERKFFEFTLIARAGAEEITQEKMIAHGIFSAFLYIHTADFVRLVFEHTAQQARTLDFARSLIDVRSGTRGGEAACAGTS